jgi:FAD/FMN-containing dehydrogenase
MQPTIRSIDEPLVSELRDAVFGTVIVPTDAAYDDARTVWNGAVDRYPSVIVRVKTTADVAVAIAFARKYDLSLAVRGGGHHVTGSAVIDDGLVIDLSGMNDVVIDPETHTAHVGPGARVSDVLVPAQEHGLSPIVGSAAQNGVAGSTLAGGIGWLRRKHGLGVDHLRSVEMVTVEGDVVTANEVENPDLFWAIRGGGPNMGIVTSFELDLVTVGPEVMVAQVAYPAEIADEVLRCYREYARSASDEVTTLAALMRVPPLPMVPEEAHGVPVVMFYSVYAGPADEGERALAPLREFAKPMMDMSGPQPLAGVHEVARELFPDARHYSWHSLYVADLSDGTIDALVTAVSDAPSMESEIGIWHMGGAIDNCDGDATAFGFRDAEFMVTIDAAWDDPDAAETNIEWARRLWETIRPTSLNGFYPGFPGFVEDEESGRMAYGDNYDRLAEIKVDYDPENVFRNNLNVEPAI